MNSTLLSKVKASLITAAILVGLILSYNVAFGQPLVQPGGRYLASATLRDINGTSVPMPTGSILVWQQTQPEIFDFFLQTPLTIQLRAKSSLANTQPIPCTLTAVYQDSVGNVIRSPIQVALAPPPTAGPAPTTVPSPTVPASSVVKSVTVTITPQ